MHSTLIHHRSISIRIYHWYTTFASNMIDRPQQGDVWYDVWYDAHWVMSRWIRHVPLVYRIHKAGLVGTSHRAYAVYESQGICGLPHQSRAICGLLYQSYTHSSTHLLLYASTRTHLPALRGIHTPTHTPTDNGRGRGRDRDAGRDLNRQTPAHAHAVAQH